ncbi:hypothetical protein KM043_015883 [Ampulex compressa]|nr:hypothetical protein KM043_015883 [Ampulex compressa]
MNGMCVLPITRRSTGVVCGNVGGSGGGAGGGGGGDRGDSGENSGLTTGANNSDGGNSGENSGGCSASGVGIPRLGIRSAASTASTNDEDINALSLASRKGTSTDARHSRAQGIRKLQKCLSTTTSHYEVDSSLTSGSFPTTSLLGAQRSTEMRSYPSTAPQASLNYQNILTSTRQYSSFGSIAI